MKEARELCFIEDPSPIPLTEKILGDLELEGSQQLNSDSPEAAKEQGEEMSTIPMRKSSQKEPMR